ncbi:uncharacterized protein [Typha angustifolia]|uniref:uncharacterized protein n=1 Tax=Typha angustifolia TaxID=59011 RepID=UPI003C2ACA5E
MVIATKLGHDRDAMVAESLGWQAVELEEESKEARLKLLRRFIKLIDGDKSIRHEHVYISELTSLHPSSKPPVWCMFLTTAGTRKMSLEFEATDGSRIVKPLFATNEIQTVRFMLGTTIVELNTKRHADGSKTLDVLLRQNLDSNIADHPMPLTPSPTPTPSPSPSSPSPSPSPSPRHPVLEAVSQSPIGDSSGSQEATETVLSVQDPGDAEKKRTREAVKKERQKMKAVFEKQMRGWMMILATLFASMTFQAGLNPPGGFWQDDVTHIITNSTIGRTEESHSAGSPILATKSSERFLLFAWCNSLAFAFSMGIVFLMLSEKFISRIGAVALRGTIVLAMVMVLVAFAAGCGSIDPKYGPWVLLPVAFTTGIFLIWTSFSVCVAKMRWPGKRKTESAVAI